MLPRAQPPEQRLVNLTTPFSSALGPQTAHLVNLEMSTKLKELKHIPANPPRWKPSADPASITVAGLDTTASVNDQIDQIDQLITLKLQVQVLDGL